MQLAPLGSITNGGLLAGVGVMLSALAVAVNPVPEKSLLKFGNVASPLWNVVDVNPAKLPQAAPQSKDPLLTASVAVPVFRLIVVLLASLTATVTGLAPWLIDVNGVSVIWVLTFAEAG